ncbi:MAG: GNAT family N-acetyltransferase [Bacteroidota bacterium]
MLNIELIEKEEDFGKLPIDRDEYVDFLYTHLDRFGDEKSAINKCLDFAFEKNGGMGGFMLAAFDDNKKLVGALVMNKTGMSEFIPENILVYVAVHESMRGKGVGRQIIEKAIEHADGNVKLHVEYDNPAKRLYERVGFKSKYAEMRFDK